jgi:hypothetical protein
MVDSAWAAKGSATVISVASRSFFMGLPEGKNKLKKNGNTSIRQKSRDVSASLARPRERRFYIR